MSVRVLIALGFIGAVIVIGYLVVTTGFRAGVSSRVQNPEGSADG